MTASPGRAPRADARRSRAAILEAALATLDADPDAGLETVASAAGVTRQTVYAHFGSRERLVAAVLDRVTEESAAAMDAAEPDAGPAIDALLRILDAGERVAGRHAGLLRAVAALPVSPDTDAARHTPIAGRIERVVRRGQRDGELDASLPAAWLAAVVIHLGHAAAELDTAELPDPRRALHTTLRRVLAPPR